MNLAEIEAGMDEVVAGADKPASQLSHDELTARIRQNEVEIAKLRVYAEADRAAGFHGRVHGTVRSIAHKTARNVVYRQVLNELDRNEAQARRAVTAAIQAEHLALKRKKSNEQIAARDAVVAKESARQADGAKLKAERAAAYAATQKTCDRAFVELCKARMPHDEFLAIITEANERVKAQETTTNE